MANNFPSRTTGFFVFLGLAAIFLGIIFPVQVVQARPEAAPVASVSLSVPAQLRVGQDFSFTTTFANTSGQTGYGPIIDLILPTNGADGHGNTSLPLDGIAFVSATYLGSPVTAVAQIFPGTDITPTKVTEPFSYDSNGQPLPVYGTPGDTLVSLQLPFGSFSPGQPPAPLTINAHLSNYADPGVPLTILARGGYEYGATALNDWCCGDATLVSPDTDDGSGWPSALTSPTIMTASKSNNAPEGETATGPNFPRRYSLSANIAPGQTITNFQFIDTLPASVQYQGGLASTPEYITATEPITIAPQNSPTSTLAIAISSISNTASAGFTFFVPLSDADGSYVINPSTGVCATTRNPLDVSGTWTPLDPRETATVVTATLSPGNSLSDCSLVLQKAVSDLTNPGSPAPLDTVEYTLHFQISDYFAFQEMNLQDILPDGIRFDSTFTPTLAIVFHGSTSSGSMSEANYPIAEHWTGAPSPVPTLNGTTEINFHVSDELVARGLSVNILGGCVLDGGTGGGDPDCSTYNGGATTGTLVFRAKIQTSYTDIYPGNRNVYLGDTLNNTAAISGTVLDNIDLSSTGNQVTNESSASLRISTPTLTKSVYAIDGSVCDPCANPHIGPGDTVTYRIKYQLPSAYYSNQVFTDFLPLPIFDASTILGAFDTAITSTIPAAGSAHFGPAETLFAVTGITPIITTSGPSSSNSVTFAYGSFADTESRGLATDILFTVAVRNLPFADGLYLTNEVQAVEDDHNPQVANAIVQVQLGESLLTSTKSVIATSNPDAILAPATVGPVAFNAPGTSGARWTGVINSTNLGTNPIHSTASGVDANDVVSFALVIQNSGTSAKGAFDLVISDTLPAGLVTPTNGTGLNLRVSYGDAVIPISYTLPSGGPASPGDLFGAGIKLADPSSTQGVCQAHSISNGLNIVIITYDLQVAGDIPPNSSMTNLGALVGYAGDAGGPNYLSAPQPMTTTVTSAMPLLTKTIAATSLSNTPNTNVAVGELVTYSATITVPEGLSSNVVLTDTLTNGLAFVTDAVTATLSSGLAMSGSITPTISLDGKTAAFNLGDLTNINNNAPISATLSLEYPVVVLNTAANTRGLTQTNGLTMRYDGGAAAAAAPDLTIVEPTLRIDKTANPAIGDAGDPITFTLDVTHTAASDADAYDVVVTDTLPAGSTYSSWVPVSGVTPDSVVQSGSAITATWNMLTLTQGSQIQLLTVLDGMTQPAQTLTNTGTLAWTSVSGDVTIPPSSYSILSTERTGDASNPGGALNNYNASSSAAITTNAPAIGKTLVATSLPNTTGVNVAIGETITYSLAITVPEGMTNNAIVTDTLPSGLALLTNTVSSTLTNALSISGAVTPTITNSGGTVVFNLGTISNADLDNATPEVIRLDYPVVVLNAVGNTRNVTRVNSVQMTYNGGALGPVAAPSVKIVEPTLAVAKNANPTTGDAGDVITYTLTVTHAGTSNSDAFNAVLTDTIPSGVSFTGSLTNPSGVAPDSLVEVNGIITATWSTLALGQGSQVQFAASLNSSVAPAQVITNRGYLAWTSLPDDVTAAQSVYNTSSTERTGNSANPGGAMNTYITNSPVNVTVSNVAPSKYIVTTSEASTPITTSVSIGEIVRYRLAARIPEGTSNNFVITDTLPSGMQFITDTTAMLAYVSNDAGITSSAFSCGNVSGNAADLNSLPSNQVTCVLPGSAISPTSFNNGTDPVFSLGNLVNSDSDADAEFAVIEFNAIVMNVVGNQSGNTLPNSFQVGVGGALLTTSTPVTITVAEPEVTLVKTRASAAPSDAGDTIVYTLAYSNTATGAGRATAFDVVLTDTLDSNLSLVAVSSVAPAGAVLTDTSTLGTGGVVSVLVDQIQPAVDLASDNGVTLTITATVVSDAANGQTIPNSANLTFTSLPGDAGTPDNPTGSTSGVATTSTGERTGSGSVNDYAASSSTVNVTLATPTLDKLLPNPTQYTIGDVVTYTICVSLPEGVTRNLIVTDTLPAYMSYVPGSGQVLADASSVQLCNSSNTPYDGTLTGASVISSNQNVALGFSADPQTADDNDTDNNTFIYQLQALVQNVIENQDGQTRTNNANLTYTNPNDGSTVSAASAPRDITIVEPALALSKTISGAPSPADAGGWLTYTVSIAHAAASHSNAYDVVFSDTLPAGLYNPSVGGVSASGTSSPSAVFTGSVLSASAFDLPLGAIVTVTYQAQIDSIVTPDQTISNTGDVAWTSQPGANVNERTGAGGVNDYEMQSSAAFTTNSPSIGKSIDSTSLTDTAGGNVAIGEVITYSVAITLPEGATPSLVVTDTLPAGLLYIPSSASTDTTGFNGSLSAMNTTTATNQVIFTFSSPVTVAGDNDPANNTLHILFQARVRDAIGNQSGTLLPNSVAMRTGGTIASSNNVTATVVSPQLSLAKTITPASASPNDPVTITLVVTNTGTSTAYDVSVLDTLSNGQFVSTAEGSTPSGFAYSATPSGGNTIVQYTGGSLDIGSSATFTFNATLASGIARGTVVANTATSTGTTLPGVDANERGISANGSANLTATAPDILVTKTDGRVTVTPGATTVYTVTVTNNGTRDATGVVLTDTLPANTVFVAADGAYTNAGGTLTWSPFSLAMGSNTTRSVTVTLNTPLAAGTNSITNSASAVDDGTHGGDTTPGNNTAGDVDTITAAPALNLLKSDGGVSSTPNGVIVYTLTYTNTGNIGASGVAITDTVPTNTQYTGGSAWSCLPNNSAGSTCTYNIGILAADSIARTVPFTVTVNSSVPNGTTQISNTARISDDSGHSSSSSDTTPLTGVLPDLAITKSDGGVTPVPGGTITYTLNYTNTGNVDATNVTITETVPVNTRYTGSGWTCAGGTGATSACTRVIPTLPGAGGSGSVQFSVTITNPLAAGTGQIANTVSIDTDTTPNDNTQTITTTINASPVLEIVKSDGGASTTAGGAVVYTMTYSNTGNLGATNVKITDTVPAKTTFTAGGSTAGWLCAPDNSAGSICTYTIGTFAGSSGSSSVNFALAVDSPVPAGTTLISNVAFISDDSGHFASSGDTTPVLGVQPEVGITKSHSGASASAAGLITYTLRYTNTGTIGASNVLITETVPANTTFAGPASTWTCTIGDPAGTPCFRNAGTLGAVGGSTSFVVLVNASLAPTTTAITNTVSIGDDSVNGTDSNLGNNSYTDSVPVTGLAPLLALSKSANLTTVDPGSIITYTLRYSNTGSTDATGVVITETVPGNTTYTGTGWSCLPNANATSQCTRAVGTLAGGGGAGSAQFVVTAANSLGGVSQIANSATIADAAVHSATASVTTPARQPATPGTLYLPFTSRLPNAPLLPTPTPTPLVLPIVDPKGMVSDGARDRLYLVNKGTNSVTVFKESTITSTTPTLLAGIPVGTEPFGIGMVDDKIYVANTGGNGPSSVSVISAATMIKLKDIPLSTCGNQATMLAVNPLTHRVYTTMHASGKVAVIDSTSDSLVGCVTTNAGAFGIAVHPASNSIFVGNRDGLDLTRIDGATNSATRIVNWRSGSGGSPYFVGINLTTNLLFAMVGLPNSNVPNKLYVYSIDSSGQLRGERIASVGNTDDGGFVLQSQCSNLIYVAETADDDVRILNPDLSLSSIVTRASGMVDQGPFGLLENPTLKRVYVSNKPGNTLKVLGECSVAAPVRTSPTATPSRTATATSMPTKVITPTVIVTLTLAPSPTLAPSQSPVPVVTSSSTPMPSRTSVPVVVPSSTLTPSKTPMPAVTLSSMPVPSTTRTQTAMPEETATLVGNATPISTSTLAATSVITATTVPTSTK